MTTPTINGGHLEDGVLVRLVDAQPDPAEAAWATEHLAGCAACRARLETLRRRSARLGRVLAGADFAVPRAEPPAARPVPGVIPLRRPAPPGRPWLRVAAVVLVTLGVGLLATPARAWIARWLGERLGPPARQETVVRPAPAPSAPAPAPAAVPSSRIRFTPTGSDFTLAVAHPQASGALVLRAVEGAEATAEVVGGTGEADLLVLPEGLRIGNEPGAAAEYWVEVPATTRRVRVRVGGGGERVVERGEIGAQLRMELEGGR